MDKRDEYRALVDGLIGRVESLVSAGIYEIPVRRKPGGACAPGWAVFAGAPSEAGQFEPCPAHTGWSGAAAGIWSAASVAAVWVKAAGSNGDGLFAGEPLEQLSRMLGWLSGELGGRFGGAESYRLAIAGRCAPSSIDEALASLSPVVSKELDAASPSFVLLMGADASKMISGPKSIGSPFEFSGLWYVVTHSPADIASDQGRKKEAFNHLKGLIKALKG